MSELVTIGIDERFWAKVDRSGGPDACWPWTGAPNAKGYGSFALKSTRPVETALAHRVAFILAGGVLTEERPYALHTCDNPPCCNAAHLYAGTNADNVADRQRRGRQARGLVLAEAAARGASARSNKAACLRGHPFEDSRRRSGHECRVCARDRKRRERAK